mmetsp:Transcript_4738/g.14296  ORF Transcript_4738/g.14296 Transcript_4738/m.14296 type:complete len:475 (+) Transcript_4738:75-1499(+)
MDDDVVREVVSEDDGLEVPKVHIDRPKLSDAEEEEMPKMTESLSIKDNKAGMERGLSAREASLRLNEDERARLKFLVKMRNERGLSEEEAQELKEICFKFLKGVDSDKVFKSVARNLSLSRRKLSGLTRGMSRAGSIDTGEIGDLGITEDERIIFNRMRKVKKKRPLDMNEELQYEAVRQKMIDYAYKANADLINMILDSDEFATKAQKKLPPAAHINEPSMSLTPFGVDHAVDLFAMPHNAIKSELSDMYTIVASIRRRSILVEVEDLELFFEWWEDFNTFVVRCFEVEDKFVMPWVTRRVNVSNTIMQQTTRNLRKAKFTYTLRQISNMKECIGNMHPGEVISKVNRNLDKLVPMLLEYFTDTERVLCPMVVRAYSEGEKKLLDREIYDFIRTTDDADLVVGLLLRWMAPKERKHWRNNVVGVFERGSFKELENAFLTRRHLCVVEEVLAREMQVTEAAKREQNEEIDATAE